MQLEARSLRYNIIIVGDFWLERISPSLLLLCSLETGEKMGMDEKDFGRILRKYFAEKF